MRGIARRQICSLYVHSLERSILCVSMKCHHCTLCLCVYVHSLYRKVSTLQYMSSLACIFKVRLCNFKATGVNKVPRAAPPFCVRGNFDGRCFNSEYIHSSTMPPMWALDTSFDYQAPSIDSLNSKYLVVECYGSDVFLGMCRLNLATLASAPPSVELCLREGTHVNGLLTFDATFQQVTNTTLQFTRIALRRIATRAVEGPPNPYLHYGFAEVGKNTESPIAANAESPEWEQLPPLHIKGTYSQLCDQVMTFDLKHSRNGFTAGYNDPVMATFDVALSAIPIEAGRNTSVPVREMVHSLPNYPYPFSTELHGLLEIRNPPKVVQQRAGVLTDDGVVGGVSAVAFPTTTAQTNATFAATSYTSPTKFISPSRNRPHFAPQQPAPPASSSVLSSADLPSRSQVYNDRGNMATSKLGESAVMPLPVATPHDLEVLDEVTEKQQTLLTKVQLRLQDVNRRRAEILHELSEIKSREEAEVDASNRRRQQIEADIRSAVAERERHENNLRAIALRREDESRIQAQVMADRERARQALEAQQMELAALEDRVRSLRAGMERHLELESSRYAQRVREAEEARQRTQKDQDELALLEMRFASAESRAAQRVREEQERRSRAISPSRGYRSTMSPSRHY